MPDFAGKIDEVREGRENRDEIGSGSRPARRHQT
jgi:hypothetical protein